MKRTPPPRLSLLMASQVPVALVLRRGPSKWVEAIRWDLRTDTFERGEWFYGRIHEERSDLSPNGELLVYLAARYSRESVWRRLERDGWEMRQALECEYLWGKGRYVTHSPDEFVRRPPREGMPIIILTRRREGRGGAIQKECRLEGGSNQVELPPGPLDWLDWDSEGRLIALSGGRIWAATLDGNRVSRFAELLDVRDDRPAERIPPRSASEW